MNILAITGHLGADAELRSTPAGDPVANFRVAFTSGFGDKKVTSWANCTLWGKRAESLAPYLTTGKAVAVAGEVEHRQFTRKDQSEGYSLNVRVEQLTFVGSKEEEVPAKRGSLSNTRNQEQSHGAPEGFPDDDIPFN